MGKWIITKERLDEIVETWNSEVAECESERMTAEEMLGYLGDPELVESQPKFNAKDWLKLGTAYAGGYCANLKQMLDSCEVEK